MVQCILPWALGFRFSNLLLVGRNLAASLSNQLQMKRPCGVTIVPKQPEELQQEELLFKCITSPNDLTCGSACSQANIDSILRWDVSPISRCWRTSVNPWSRDIGISTCDSTHQRRIFHNRRRKTTQVHVDKICAWWEYLDVLRAYLLMFHQTWTVPGPRGSCCSAGGANSWVPV